jgi:putative ABC transport system permease protein
VISVLKNEFRREPLFKEVSFGSNGYMDRMQINGHGLDVFKKVADENLIPLLQIPLVAGRNFNGSDANAGVIVNETFVRRAGIDYAVGARVDFDYRDEKFTRRIIGVVKDYHYNSPRAPILPMVMFMNKNPDGDIWIKVDQANMQQAIGALSRIYKKAMPSALFEYSLMDESNAKDFYQEMQWQKVVTAGAIASLVICMLGLFGLAHLSIYQRIKEIGIRKVLGASLSQIVLLLTGGFLKLVLAAIVIASPLAWIAMHYWLRNYAYHIDIGPAIFIGAGGLAISIAFVSISYQTFRFALTNPVKCLRSET